MKIWIHLDGMQQGPFDPDKLPIDRITPQTPVWHEGMPDWAPAATVPLVAALLNNAASGGVAAANYASSNPQTTETTAYAANYHTAQAAQTAQAVQAEKPASYLVWMIILTILTFNPLGIAGIFTSLAVRRSLRRGNYVDAAHMSEITAWILMIMIVSLFIMPFFMFI